MARMTAVPVYAGVIVRELDVSVTWYTRALGCRLAEEGAGWALLSFGNGSAFELFSGDPDRPGLTFPSYGAFGDQAGPSVMPGFAVEEPEELALGLSVARRLPDWVVVVAPDGLRIVLSERDGDGASGLVGFRFSSPEPEAQRAFLGRVTVDATVDEGGVGAVPLVAGDRDDELTDPDGTRIALVSR